MAADLIPIDDPDDCYFGRVLAYGPDPLLAFALAPTLDADGMLPESAEPALPVDPEQMRVIFPAKIVATGLAARGVVWLTARFVSVRYTAYPERINLGWHLCRAPRTDTDSVDASSRLARLCRPILKAERPADPARPAFHKGGTQRRIWRLTNVQEGDDRLGQLR
jgi:hypothetical protein